MKIAWIGLGNMGAPMATNIARSGYSLRLFDLDKTKAAPLLSLGALWCDDARSAVFDADVVMTSLPTPESIDTLALGEYKMLDAMKAGSVWIELSTNNLVIANKINQAAMKRGIALLDAPVSGGIEGAADGTLTVLIGGDEAVYKRCLPIFNVIGKEVKYLGKYGAGYVAKIAQVVLCYLHSIALSEALMLGVKGGVSAQAMLDIIQNSTGRSYVADRYGPTILNGSYDPGFTLGLAHKDMKLTLELARSVDATLPMCEQVEAIYAKAIEAFGSEQNHLMAVRLLEQDNDTPLRASP